MGGKKNREGERERERNAKKDCLSNRMSNNSDKKNNDTKPLFAINIPLYYPIVMARSINNIPLIG